MDGTLLALAVIALIAIASSRKQEEIPAEFIVASDLRIDPETVYPGEAIFIEFVLTNTSPQAGNHTVNMEVDMTVFKQTITLQPGESKPVSFQISLTDLKTYNVSVDGLTGQITVVPQPAANFVVSDLVINPTEINPGETVDISVTVTNIGDAAGTKEIICEVV